MPIKQQQLDGSLLERMEDWPVCAYGKAPHSNPNLICTCGSNTFQVCWHVYPYSGGYCHIFCSQCGSDQLLMDSYA